MHNDNVWFGTNIRRAIRVLRGQEDATEYDAKYEAELKRRKFMQFHGRYLGWGIVSPTDGRPVVRFYSEGWARVYDTHKMMEFVGEDGVAAAEERIIDRAIAEWDALAVTSETL